MKKSTSKPVATIQATPVNNMDSRDGIKTGAELIIFAIVVGGFIFWIWSLVSLASNKLLVGFNKIFWLLVIFLLPVIGPLLYLFIGNKKK